MAAAAAATASRRYLPSLLTRHLRSLLLPSTSLATPKPRPQPLRSPPPPPFFPGSARHFCSKREESDPEEDESDEEGEEEESYEEATTGVSSRLMDRSGKTEVERKAEAEEIGYKVVGPLEPTENPFKPYEPVFAVVQVGSHQFKVSNGDSIFTERLKFCDVNDKLVLNKVLMLGSTTQTVIGRPTLPDAVVHVVVEEHALDAKVIIFKKKRRKNYRRTKGHRQELTKLRITDIQGIEKPTSVTVSA